MAVIRPLLIGFATTLKHMFKKPITVNYPDQKVPMFPKYRGKQVLMRDENGLEKCVACGLCSVACPADAIYLEAAENDGTVQAGPRYASVYQIHKTRCIFCGYCEEACPVGAIFMGKDYELAVYSKDDFIWDKTDLLVPAATTAPGCERQDRAGRARDYAVPPRPSPDLHPSDHADRRARRHPRRLRHRSARSCSGTPTCRSGCGRRRREQRRRVLHADRAALLDQGQQRGLRRDRGGDRRRPLAPTLHYLPNGGPHMVGPWRVAALGGTFAPSWYNTPAAALPPSKGRKRPRRRSSSARAATTSAGISCATK